MRFEKSCGAVIFCSIGKELAVLLVKQNAGHWSFPKGHVEAGETEYETALREIREETGLEVEICGDFRSVVTYSPSKNIMKDVIYFTARPKSGEIKAQKSEISLVEWVSVKEAEKRITFDADRELLSKAVVAIQK